MSSAGMILLTGGGSFVSIFLGIELTSLPLYILTGIMRDDEASFEGAIKYFLLGSFASAILLMGMAYIFGETGHLLLKDVKGRIFGETSTFLIFGFILFLVGLFFKIAVVPFHIWVPDAYQGAPSPIAGFMSVAVKAGAFAVLIRLLDGVFTQMSSIWSPILYVLSLLTIIWGSLLGIVQEDFKRLLAYSSIVHAGFILLSLLNLKDNGSATMFYLIIYSFMNLGAFGVITAMSSEKDERTSFEFYRGLFSRDPLIAFMLLIFVFSLAGIPPTGGFWAKFYVFKSAVEAGYVFPVLIALLGAVIALYYYLKIIIYSFIYASQDEYSYIGRRDYLLRLSLLILGIATIYFGIYPKEIFHFISPQPFFILGK